MQSHARSFALDVRHSKCHVFSGFRMSGLGCDLDNIDVNGSVPHSLDLQRLLNAK